MVRKGFRRRSIPGGDLRRRRWIRRVLLAWIVVTLMAGAFYAMSKSRARRQRPNAVQPARTR